jgi:hypothetical protein
MKTTLKNFTAWYYSNETCTISCSEHIMHSTINPVVTEVLSACSFADHHLKKGQKMILSFLKGQIQIAIIKCSEGSIEARYMARAVINNRIVSDIKANFDAGMLAILLANDLTKTA